MDRRLFLVAAVLGLAGGIAGQALFQSPSRQVVAQEGEAGTEQPRIGFIDVKKVFEKYQKTRDREKAINDQFRAGMEDLRKRKLAFDAKNDQVRLFAPNSPERRKGERELALEAFQIQFEEGWMREKVKNDLKLATEEIYAEILARLAEYSEKSGFGAVLKVDEEEIQSFTQNDLKLKIHTRTVLFHRKSEDLTDPFIEYLNR